MLPDAPDRPVFKEAAVLYNPRIEESMPTAKEIVLFLIENGIPARMISSSDECGVEDCLEAVTLLVVLGGDGTTLRAARISYGREIPILGVNFGRLGFLSEIEPDNWRENFDKLLRGDYWVEKRMMLTASVWQNSHCTGEYHALNDVVISRGGLARVIWLRTQVNGAELATYIADGLIISTPTGSTAYALAAGGPVLPPDLRNILLQPIAPHMTLDRSVILSEGARIRVHVRTDHQATLTVDGQSQVDLMTDDLVEVAASTYVSRFIRLGDPAYFYDSLLSRLNLPGNPNQNDTPERLDENV